MVSACNVRDLPQDSRRCPLFAGCGAMMGCHAEDVDDNSSTLGSKGAVHEADILRGKGTRRLGNIEDQDPRVLTNGTPLFAPMARSSVSTYETSYWPLSKTGFGGGFC